MFPGHRLWATQGSLSNCLAAWLCFNWLPLVAWGTRGHVISVPEGLSVPDQTQGTYFPLIHFFPPSSP